MTIHPLVRKIVRFCKITFFVFLIFSISGVILYRFIPVPFTPLMCQRFFEQVVTGKKIHIAHDWVSLKKISPHVIQAAIAGEDNNFPYHYGIDFKAIKKAQKFNKRGKRLRGASTITQQTCKNVYLWLGRNYLRKSLEVYFTILVETCWSKERIMEVYLNSIEMGDGIFGIEAAAQKYYKKSASKLSRYESAMIVAAFPNPRKRNPAKPSTYLMNQQHRILSIMGKMGKVEL